MATHPPGATEHPGPKARTVHLGSAPLPSAGPDLEGAITDCMVGLLLRHTGRQPTEANTVMSAGLVVVTLTDLLTEAEGDLAAAGHSEPVLPTRDLMLRGMRAEATAVIEQITQREVAAYLTDQQNEPDLAVIIFLLAPFRLRAA